MTPEQYERAKKVFVEARQRSENDRAAYLDDACADDADVRAKVEALLRVDSLLPSVGVSVAAHRREGGEHSGAEALLDHQIGHYRIRDVIGEGGMGVVFRAEQEHPRRVVALKIINPGVASGAVLRRFEHEAEILGRLQHPGIAQIYEAGTFDLGAGPQPFFAMEYVHGDSLTIHAARHVLSTRETLALLVKVCDAVQHAHQKGVIHRDLKPGNILVTSDGQPKVLDFGLARATASDVQMTTIRTAVGQLIGTVPYMSPEQAAGDPSDIDTRSDVYALGIICYELLSGWLPYELDGRLVHEALRRICEEEPRPLSTLDRTLRGDVETILAKALEKDKARRYQSAREFAADIERYLRDEPIVARPPSTWYQFSKFARRNRGLVGGTAAAFVFLLLGIIATTLFAIRAEERRLETEAALMRVEQAEREAQRRADDLERVSAFQAAQLADIDTAHMGVRLRQSILDKYRTALETQGLDDEHLTRSISELETALTAVNFTNVALESLEENIFDRALTAIEDQFADQPLVKAQLLHTVGRTLRELGMLGSAAAPFAEAIDIRRRELGDDHPDALHSINAMGVLLAQQGRYAEAEPHFQEALERRRRLLGQEHPDTLASLRNVGTLLLSQHRFADAEELLQETLAASRGTLGDEHPETLGVINNLASVLSWQGRLDEAEPYFSELLEAGRRVFGDQHPETQRFLQNLGFVLSQQGRCDEAEPYLREALASSRSLFGDAHPRTITALDSLGVHYGGLERYPEAEPYLREALAASRATLGEEHPNTLLSINNMSIALRMLDRFDESVRLSAEAIEKARRVFPEGQGDWYAGIFLVERSKTLTASGRYTEAEEDALGGYAILKASLGTPHERTIDAMRHLADLYDAWHAEEPHAGRDVSAAEWRARLETEDDEG